MIFRIFPLELNVQKIIKDLCAVKFNAGMLCLFIVNQ